MNEKQTIKLLMVDDHQIIIEGYQRILSAVAPENFTFVYDAANSCDVAWKKIQSQNYDLIMLDLSFPVTADSMITSGDQLGQKIKENYPEIKLIILTGSTEASQLRMMIKKINPEGFLLKGETNSREIWRCIETLLDGNKYYSLNINKIIQAQFVNDFELDEYDRKILEQLSLGVKTKNIPNTVPLSLRSVEVRKRKLRALFQAQDDEELLRKARTIGYL